MMVTEICIAPEISLMGGPNNFFRLSSCHRWISLIGPNISWGRIQDGSDTWIRFESPTPQMSNLQTSVQDVRLHTRRISLYPNPAKDHAVFEVILNEASDLRVEIIDSKGTICTSIMEFHFGNGTQLFKWNLEDASGSRLESGLYFCRILTRKGVLTRKILVSR